MQVALTLAEKVLTPPKQDVKVLDVAQVWHDCRHDGRCPTGHVLERSRSSPALASWPAARTDAKELGIVS